MTEVDSLTTGAGSGAAALRTGGGLDRAISYSTLFGVWFGLPSIMVAAGLVPTRPTAAAVYVFGNSLTSLVSPVANGVSERLAPATTAGAAGLFSMCGLLMCWSAVHGLPVVVVFFVAGILQSMAGSVMYYGFVRIISLSHQGGDEAVRSGRRRLNARLNAAMMITPAVGPLVMSVLLQWVGIDLAAAIGGAVEICACLAVMSVLRSVSGEGERTARDASAAGASKRKLSWRATVAGMWTWWFMVLIVGDLLRSTLVAPQVSVYVPVAVGKYTAGGMAFAFYSGIRMAGAFAANYGASKVRWLTPSGLGWSVLAAGASGLPLVALALHAPFPVVLLLAFVGAGCDDLYYLGYLQEAQDRVPAAELGRWLSVDAMIARSVIPAFVLAAPAAATQFSVPTLMLVGGLVSLLLPLVQIPMLRMRGFR